MLSSIHPLGEAGRGNRYVHTATAFTVGSTLGGATTGLVLGTVGAALAWMGLVALVVVALIVVAGLIVVGRLFGRRPPSLPRQVNENWLVEYRGWVYGFGFGYQLGLGVVTYIRSTFVWLWLGAAVAVGTVSVPAAVLVGAGFGVTRGLSVFTTRSIHNPESLIEFHRRLHHTTTVAGAES